MVMNLNVKNVKMIIMILLNHNIVNIIKEVVNFLNGYTKINRNEDLAKIGWI